MRQGEISLCGSCCTVNLYLLMYLSPACFFKSVIISVTAGQPRQSRTRRSEVPQQPAPPSVPRATGRPRRLPGPLRRQERQDRRQQPHGAAQQVRARRLLCVLGEWSRSAVGLH